MSADIKAAAKVELSESPNFSNTEEASGIIACNLPAHPTHSAELWGFSLCDELPKRLTSDGVEAVASTYECIRDFVVEHYAMFSEEGLGSTPNPSAQKSKQAYLSRECDLIGLRHAEKLVGIMVGAPEDWSSYYVRVFALVPEYQRAGLTRRFVRECLFEPLTRNGVERVVADTNPSNIAMTRLFTELGFFVTGNQLTDRWGPLIRYTKFLDPACEQLFRRRFGGSAPRRRRRNTEEEVP